MAKSENGDGGNGRMNGLFVRGIVVSSEARVVKRKDGSGRFVVVTHELALQPGLAIYERFLDPEKEPGLTLRGDEIVGYEKLPELEQVAMRVLRWREHDGRLIITQAERLGQ